MPANNLIQFRKGSSTEWSNENPVLKSGEPGFSVDDNIFKIGDGVTVWDDLISVGSATYSNYVISTGQTSFATATGYTVGTLELYQNGVKLVNSLDFSATNGSTVTLSGISPSGSILDYRIATVNVCAGSQGGGTTYTAGTGLVLVNTEFNIDSSVMQTGDISTSLAAGTDIGLDYDSGTDVLTINYTGGGGSYTAGTGIYVDGSNVINIDDSVLTTGNLVAGSGLSKSGYTLNVDNTVLRTGDLGTNLTAGTGVVLEESGSDLSINVMYTGHPVIPAASSSNNSGSVVIQDVIVDGNGHVTGLGTTDISELFTQGDGMTLTTGTLGDITFAVDPTVVRSGDNVSVLVNDSGYLTGFDLSGSGFLTGVPDNIDIDSVTAATGSFATLRFGNDNITLPVADGTSGQYLETNGDGVLEWVSADSDANTFVTGVTYSDATRVVTLLRNDGTNLTAHLDGLATSGDLSNYVEISNLSGSMSGVASSGDNISIFVNDSGYINAHPAVDAASSSDNAGQVFIQDLLFDEFGHVTGVSTATASDDNTTYTAGSGLELNGTEFDVRAGDGIQISSDNVAVDNTVVRTTNTYENPSWLTSINANILSGEVPAANLPSYVDDVLEYNGTGNFPTTGETGKIYLDTSTNFSYRWGGSAYVQIVDGKATWGGIDGTLSNQTDLSNALGDKADITYVNIASGDLRDGIDQNTTWIGQNTTSGVAFDTRITANETDIDTLSGLITDNDDDISNLSGLVGQNTASGLQSQTDVGTLSGLIDDLEAVSGAEQQISHSWNNTTAQLVSTLTPGNTVTQQLFEGKLYGDANVTYLKTDVDLGIGTVPSAALHIKGEYVDDGYLMIEDTSSTLKTKFYNGNTTSVISVDEDNEVPSSAFTIQVDGDNKGTFGASSTTLDQSVTINASTNQCVFGNTVNVLNEGGADVNFRVEGLTDNNLLLCDASKDSVLIGNSTDGSVNSKLHVYEDNKTDSTYSRTINVLGRAYSTTDGSYYHIGINNRAEKYLSDSVNDGGYVVGTNSVPVTYGDGTSTTLAEMTAIRANMSLNTTASGVTITNAYDIKCIPSLAGTDNTVTNHYGLFLQQGAGSTTVTNRFGVYQQDPNADNIFLGPVGVGATNLGSHDLVVNGTSKFDSEVIVDSRVSTAELYVSNDPTSTTLPLGVRSVLEDTTRVETLNVNGEYTFPTTDGTASGQVLVTDGNGSVAWEDQAGGGTSNVDRATLSLTSAQQTFSVSNGYDTGAIDVYLNGVKLADSTDFTASNGTSFVLTEAAASGDIVQYTTYDRLTTNGLVSDSGDTMTGDLTINANLAVTGTIDNDGVAFAWVKFDGSQTEANMISKDYNIDSITDKGVGRYEVNFATAASDGDYSVVAQTNGKVNVQHTHAFVGPAGIASNTANYVYVGVFSSASSTNSADGIVHLQVFGG